MRRQTARDAEQFEVNLSGQGIGLNTQRRNGMRIPWIRAGRLQPRAESLEMGRFNCSLDSRDSAPD